MMQLLTQGIYFCLTGIWPLIHVKSFMRVTGPKVDVWLVRTVGVLVLVEGLFFLLSYYRDTCTLETMVLAIGSALGLAAIDIVYALKGRIRKVYLVDAAVEFLFVLLWIVQAW